MNNLVKPVKLIKLWIDKENNEYITNDTQTGCYVYCTIVPLSAGYWTMKNEVYYGLLKSKLKTYACSLTSLNLHMPDAKDCACEQILPILHGGYCFWWCEIVEWRNPSNDGMQRQA